MIRTKLKCLCVYLCLLSITCDAQNFTNFNSARLQSQYDEDDTVVIEAAPTEHRRRARQIDFYQGSWTQALGEGSACLSSSGLLGSCMSFHNCYPYYKFPLFGYYDSFLGNNEQCTYVAATGQQEFGICCMSSGGVSPVVPGSPQQITQIPQFPQFPQFPQYPQFPQFPQFPTAPTAPPTPPTTPEPVAEPEKPQRPTESNVTNFEDIKLDWPPPIPTHPPTTVVQWPPPIPTHPPDHTSPTHPTRPISSFPSWPPQSPAYPTYPTYPSYPTFPTRPPSSPIASYPGFPSWPPTAPQKPPTTKPPSWPPTTKPPSWPPTTKPPSWPPTTKPPSWPPSNQPSWPPTTKPPSWPPTTKPPAWPPTTKPPSWPPTTKPPSWPPTTKPPTTTPTEPPNSLGGGFQPQCGAKNGVLDQERIVGGQSASPNEWPWIVVLFNNGRQFCGGSLLDNLHILTAAHCVAHMSSWDVARLKAHLGDHNIKSASEVQHVERAIKRVVRHRGFDSRTLYNDVAILTMDRAVEYTQNIKPICLPTGSSTYTGKVATVIGWGSLRENGQQPSILQKVTIPIWTNQDCAIKYGPAAPGGIIETMLCAGQPSRDSCSGDSGGPLMINEGRWVQVGIVSWGIGCGKGQYPGVYSRVTHFLPWIQKNLEGNY